MLITNKHFYHCCYIIVLYLLQSAYRPFLIPYYNIIQCIVFNFVIVIIVFIFISKYLHHSFETLLRIALFLFYQNFQSIAYSDLPVYLILPNAPTSHWLGSPHLFGNQEYCSRITILNTDSLSCDYITLISLNFHLNFTLFFGDQITISK